MDYAKIDNIYIGGINTNDYPDFSDAFILSADYEGKPMNEKQLDLINEDTDFVHQFVINNLF